MKTTTTTKKTPDKINLQKYYTFIYNYERRKILTQVTVLFYFLHRAFYLKLHKLIGQ